MNVVVLGGEAAVVAIGQVPLDDVMPYAWPIYLAAWLGLFIARSVMIRRTAGTRGAPAS